MTVWFCMLLVFGQKPDLNLENGMLELHLKWADLRDPRVERRLVSGLTTTIQLRTEVRQGDRISEETVLILIRYELWEERLQILQLGPSLQAQTWEIGGPEALAEWFKTNPIHIAPSRPGKLAVKVRARVLPFSELEGEQTKQWFNQVVQVPEAASRSQPNPNPNQNLTRQTPNPVFEAMMSRSLDLDALIDVSWKWNLP